MSYSAPQAHLKWQVPPGAAVPELSCEEALRAAYPGVAATFDAIMSLDDAAESPKGDEFAAQTQIEDSDRPMTARPVDLADKVITLLEGHDELMMLYADQRFVDDPIWSLMKAQRTAMMTFL